jgi:hypothetical protein
MVNRRTYRRVPILERNAALRIWLKELAEERIRFGSPRLLLFLRREGWVVNHKRVDLPSGRAIATPKAAEKAAKPPTCCQAKLEWGKPAL